MSSAASIPSTCTSACTECTTTAAHSHLSIMHAHSGHLTSQQQQQRQQTDYVAVIVHRPAASIRPSESCIYRFCAFPRAVTIYCLSPRHPCTSHDSFYPVSLIHCRHLPSVDARSSISIVQVVACVISSCVVISSDRRPVPLFDIAFVIQPAFASAAV